MNIHYLDHNPKVAARYLCNQHVKEMLGESVALLSYVSGKNGGPRPDRRTRGIGDAHGAVAWLMSDLGNFGWLRDHAWAMWEENLRRFGTDSKYGRHLEALVADPPGLPDIARTPFKPATVKGHEDLFAVPDDPVGTCRRYYAFRLLDLEGGDGTWPEGERPAWVDEIRASATPEQRDAIREALHTSVQQGSAPVYKGKDPETGIDLYECERKTALRRSPKFEEKGLATHAVEAGFVCDHQCAYCSVSASIRTHNVFKQIGRTAFEPGYAIVDPGVAARLATEAPRLTAKDVVMVSSLSDAWTPAARRYGIGRACLEYLLQHTPAQVRVLTKNAHVRHDFDLLERYRDRVMVGLTVSGLPEHEKAIVALEPFASTITERIAAMHEAHARGLRTYAMFCPLLPGIFAEQRQFDELFAMAVAWNAEVIWTEGVNARGTSLLRCEESLRKAGFSAYADAVGEVRNKRRWSEYATRLTKDLQAAARRSGLADRQVLMNYDSAFTPEDRLEVDADPEGVVWL